MTSPTDYAFFKTEIQQKLHQIIGILPLQAYLPPSRQSKQHQSINYFSEAVQYFLIEPVLPIIDKKEEQKMASDWALLNEKTAFFSKEVEERQIILQIKMVQKEAIVEVRGFRIVDNRFISEKEWRKSLKKQTAAFVQKLLDYSILFEFTGIKISLIALKQQKISLIMEVGFRRFFIYLSLVSLHEFQQFQQNFQIKLLQSLREQVKSQQIPRIQIDNKVDENETGWNFYSNLNWNQKAKVLYLCQKEYGLTFNNNRLCLMKRQLYIFNICQLVPEAIKNQQILEQKDISELIRNLVIESEDQQIIKIFEQICLKILQCQGKTAV